MYVDNKEISLISYILDFKSDKEWVQNLMHNSQNVMFKIDFGALSDNELFSLLKNGVFSNEYKVIKAPNLDGKDKDNVYKKVNFKEFLNVLKIFKDAKTINTYLIEPAKKPICISSWPFHSVKTYLSHSDANVPELEKEITYKYISKDGKIGTTDKSFLEDFKELEVEQKNITTYYNTNDLDLKVLSIRKEKLNLIYKILNNIYKKTKVKEILIKTHFWFLIIKINNEHLVFVCDYEEVRE